MGCLAVLQLVMRLLWCADGPGSSEGLREGDTVVTNHPVAGGGSHLPDITVITPVWDNGEIVFFVASRGHHAGACTRLTLNSAL